MQIQVFMGGILVSFFCLASRIPPLLQRPIGKVWCPNNEINMTVVLQGINIIEYFTSTSLLFSFEPKTWHGD